MAVITISRQVGSLGTEIAQTLAKQLHYNYLDKEGIEQGLTTCGLSLTDVEKFDEKSPPFWQSWQIQSRKFLNAIRLLILEAAHRNHVVIVGRGGQILLRDMPGVLHVRIVAPFETRLQRMMAETGGDAKEVAQALRHGDRDSAGFIRFFFDQDWERPDLYDLILNTRLLTVTEATTMIETMVSSTTMQEGEKQLPALLNDLIIQQKVDNALLSIGWADRRMINVEVEAGRVALQGTVSSQADVDYYLGLVRAIDGVKDVENRLVIFTPCAT